MHILNNKKFGGQDNMLVDVSLWISSSQYMIQNE